MQEIPKGISGVDTEEGIKNCGGIELYIGTVENFYKLIDSKSRKIEDSLATGKIYDYTVEVHALKNTARMIGASELSERFYELECLGKDNQTEKIKKKTPEVLALYRSYKENLKDIQKVAGQKSRVEADRLADALRRLHEAADRFDLDLADKVMEELDGYLLPQDLDRQMEQLDVALTDVAMEDVLRLTEEMQSRLEKKAVILLVDDDETNRYVIMNLLGNEYRMISAASGEEAFAILEHQIPDLILLDVYMTKMDGHDVLHRLKSTEAYEDIPVVFLTGDRDENTEVQGFNEGVTDFFRKPLRKAVAIQRINRILELSYLRKNLEKEVERQTERAEKRRKRVERISLQMVQALANTIDAKDSYTNGHSTRVAKYAVLIAEHMGYEGELLERLQYAALLHDIGKIGVPREIINKPAPLTDEEYAIIKTHPIIGGGILEEITELPDIAVGARWHHERYDGKGYPDKLRREEIPELARIIGVADAYDAMTSKRSYRDVLPQEIVLREIVKGKGSQFDPVIADHMMDIIKKDVDYRLHE